MQFRIVGPHNHQAVVAGNTFTCIRNDVTTEHGVTITWIASRNGEVLKGDCRTLNEAKGLCRSSAAGGVPSV